MLLIGHIGPSFNPLITFPY